MTGLATRYPAAFAAGRAACKRTSYVFGGLTELNPYPRGSGEYYAWREGWQDCMPEDAYEGTDGKMGVNGYLTPVHSRRRGQ